jgi:TPR repeat protein
MLRVTFLALCLASAASARPAETTDLIRDGLAAYASGNHPEARTLLRAAAHRNAPAAETMLGVMAARGEGGPRNDAVAAAWFLRAARRGYVPAQLALADRFARGRGVPHDRVRALALAQAASAHGQPGAADLVRREARLSGPVPPPGQSALR